MKMEKKGPPLHTSLAMYSNIFRPMLTHAAIAHLRLHNQHILRSQKSSPQTVAAWHGAMQAQDYAWAKWAIGLRLPDATDVDVEQALSTGSLVRTHILRPTWHIVAAQDVRWMMRLTAPQIDAQSAAMQRDMGLDAAIFKKTNALIAKALEGSRHMTRSELAEVIGRAGIAVNSLRMVHIMFRAELDLLVCSGVRRGKEQTYALLDERVPPTPVLSREESLAELARRYFSSHAPATVQDFTWWSGLKVGDARTALEMIKSDLVAMPLDNLTYWMPKETALPSMLEPSAHLLPAFDEFMVSYKERGASLDSTHSAQTITANGIFKPIIVVNGRVAGVWSRTEKKNALTVELNCYAPLSDLAQAGIEQAADRFGRFLGKNEATGVSRKWG